jgi:hypothetical protein
MHWATFWAIFFTNASGHPGRNVLCENTESSRRRTEKKGFGLFEPRVARWYIFNQKIQIWVIFGGS